MPVEEKWITFDAGPLHRSTCASSNASRANPAASCPQHPRRGQLFMFSDAHTPDRLLNAPMPPKARRRRPATTLANAFGSPTVTAQSRAFSVNATRSSRRATAELAQ